MPQSLNPAEFLYTPGVILDVRSPAEYAQGHIPGAISFPLFSDEERAQVGICYKHQGQDQAVELGFAIAGPKFANFIATAKALAPNHQVRLHCWRGGMRSAGVAWVLEAAGMNITLLKGGYKTFRHWVRAAFQVNKNIIILGGMTGTGKTDILSALAAQGRQVLDLEGLASHRGSSYGSLGLPAQPTNEQFENLVAMQWATFDSQQPVWVEAESRRIGTCRVPEDLFQQMMRSPVVEVIRSRSERLALLADVYGTANRDELVAATERIRKRLGGLRTQQSVDLLHEGKLVQAIDIVLDYYDKTYRYDLEKRNVPIHTVDVSGLAATDCADLLTLKAGFQPQELFVS